MTPASRYQPPGWFTTNVFNSAVAAHTRIGLVPILRAYLERWKWEVGAFFGGVGPDSADAELRRIAPDHPIFRIERSPR